MKTELREADQRAGKTVPHRQGLRCEVLGEGEFHAQSD